MFTGIFVILFWSYQRLINTDNNEKTILQENEEDHTTEFLTIDKDVIDVFFRKSDTLAQQQEILEEQIEEIQYEYATDPGSVFGTIELDRKSVV